ncbi:hypothetical protein [Candidatus Rariloculus sp.]|uniref:hypothetical protein n=1 Tax=Candidatus Rariloculus sp. TaxID=3101265 RepID=UPI003D0D39E2
MALHRVEQAHLKLVEQCAGVGELTWRDRVFPQIRYRINRYQGMARSGLPVPGLHRIEGSVEIGAIPESTDMAGSSLKLRLEDGRSLAITIATGDGRVLTEGHGPGRCGCC